MRLAFKRLFISDCKGAAAIEFALVFPVFIFLLMGIIEFGLIMHVNSLVDNAVHEGARMGSTGNSYADLSGDPATGRQAFIDDYIRKQLGSWVQSGDQITITTKIVGSVADVGGNVSADTYNGYGDGGQAVVYNVQYKWKVLTPLLSSVIGDGEGDYLMRATAVVKNEDF